MSGKKKTEAVRCRMASLDIGAPLVFRAAKKDGGEYPLTRLELRVRLHAAWEACRRLANLAVRECARHDAPPMPGERMAAMPAGGAYGRILTKGGKRAEGRWAEWIGSAQSASCVIRHAEEAYRRERHQVYVAGTRSLLQFSQKRYALPVHPQSWSVKRQDERLVLEFPLPELPLAGVAGKALAGLAAEGWPPGSTLPAGRAAVQLLAGSGRGRDIGDVRRIADGHEKMRELRITRRPMGQTKGVPVESAPGGGQRSGYQLQARFVVARKPETAAAGTNVMLLRSDATRLLAIDRIGSDPGSHAAYEAHADHLRRAEASVREAARRAGRTWEDVRGMVADHKAFVSRLALDNYHEARAGCRKRRAADLLERRCRKQRDRLDTFMGQEAARIAGLCRRQRVGAIVLDLACKDYLPSFPWFAFVARLRDTMADSGVAVVETPEEAEALKDKGTQACDTNDWTGADGETAGAAAELEVLGSRPPRRRWPTASPGAPASRAATSSRTPS